MPLLLMPLGAGSAGPTPPAPTPTSTGDGVALVGGNYIRELERLRARGRDPWKDIAAWLRRLAGIDEWQVTREQQARADAAARVSDERDVDDIVTTRRRL